MRVVHVKWAQQVRSRDLKILKLFSSSFIVTKALTGEAVEHIKQVPVCKFLFDFGEYINLGYGV